MNNSKAIPKDAPHELEICSIDDSIALLVSRCLNRFSDATATFLDGFDLKQFGVLHAIYRRGITTPSALARLCFTTTAAITYTLDVLEKKELLVRKRSGNDRRVVELELTAKGEELIVSYIPKSVAAQNHVLTPLNAHERAVLRTLLQRIAHQD